MPRKLYYWKLNNRELALGQRTLIAGVLNLTPDSFHDGGRYQDPDRAYARALELEEQGAGIIDIGAESTRPGSTRITAAIELQRLTPVLKRLRDKLRVPISVDTYKAEVAERAIELGAEIINDPSGLTFDPGLAKVVVQHNAGIILNHMRGRPESWGKLPPAPDVMGMIVKELEATVSRARHAGLDKSRIVIDPGLGFGKRKEQNSEILARLAELSQLDFPIMAGPSNKSFLAQPTPTGTQFATAGAVAAAILGGAHIVRVHDVAEMHAVAFVADEIAKSAALLPSAQ
jgi:dihydropteroate synthase